MSLELTFHGAAGCVTGFCARLKTERATVLIDCGMFQGPKTLKALNYEPFPFRADEIDAVLLTHPHIDHSGLLPKLMRAGYKGPILATPGTRDLCGVMLPDAGDISIEIVAGRNASVNFDMQSLASLVHGDRVRVCRSEHQVRFLHPRGWSYYATLHRKLHWHSGVN